MSDLSILAHVRDEVGYIIRLRPFETVNKFLVTETEITVSIDRVVSEPRGRGGINSIITKRGTEVFQFRYHIDLRGQGRWVMSDRLMVWWSTEELVRSVVPRTPDAEWEQMCYRPGTDTSPMDGPVRKAQGY